MRVCLITEEVASAGGSGGIGGAIEELSIMLARRGAEVDVLCTAPPADSNLRADISDRFEKSGVHLSYLDLAKYTWSQSLAARSYAAYKTISENGKNYDFIHYHEYHGVGFYLSRAKRQGLRFQDTQLVVQCHGSVEWALECNEQLPSDDEHLQVIHLEKESIRNADILVSPSEYLIGWMLEHEYVMPKPERRFVIQNVCTGMMREVAGAGQRRQRKQTAVDEIVMFGRHEPRKGFKQFVEALTIANEQLTNSQTRVTFLGGFGKTSGYHSGAYLARVSKSWGFDWRVEPSMNRYEALRYLRSNDSNVVFVPSPAENSPYTVLEALALKRALITSNEGGARELINSSDHADCLIDISPRSIADKMLEAIEFGAVVPEMATTMEETEKEWFDFHKRFSTDDEKKLSFSSESGRVAERPKVVLGITHYERPRKLLDAIMSAVRQTYDNIEIVVLDDGSPSKATKEALAKMEPFLERIGGRIIYAENGYLGAARNTLARNSESEYLCFLDDDDVAAPELIETLVTAATASGADVTNCLNVFMPEVQRDQTLANSKPWPTKVSYLPTVGPLELAPTSNVFGAATALIKRSAFESVGGYTELKGVGHEDYELFVRMLQEGFTLDVVPEPLYLYEVDRPSMISNTSAEANFKRVVDCIDTRRNAQDWNRFLLRVSGQKAVESEKNRRIWESQRDGLYDIEQSLFDFHGTTGEQLSRLRELAARLGSETAVAAFSGESAVRRNNHNSAMTEAVKEALAQQYNSLSESIAVDARLVTSPEEAQVVMGELLTHLNNKWGLNDSDWRAIKALMEVQDLDSESITQLQGLVSERLEGDLDIKLVGPIAFSLAKRAGVPRSAYHALFDAICDFESDEYLRLNPDVQRAVESGVQDTALGQFARGGFKQGRQGFEAVCEILSRFEDLPREFSDDRRRYLNAIAVFIRQLKD